MIAGHPRNLASAFASGRTIGHEAVLFYPPEIEGCTTNPVSTKPGQVHLALLVRRHHFCLWSMIPVQAWKVP
jgi:hypothetical protein